MADDYTQRPYRPNEPPARSGQPGKALGGGSDPLAELARLIGQNDPFSEFGRDGVRRSAPPPQPPQEPEPAWDDAPPAASYEPYPIAPDQHATSPNYPRQTFGGAPAGEFYQGEAEVPGYPAPHTPDQSADLAANLAPNYQDVPYNRSNVHLDPQQDDYYDDEPPSRRRMGVMVIAGVFALAVIGTASAFGYRALFGSPSASGPPPVIKADTAPSKIVPASAKDPQSNKQITDRVNDKGIGEKLVSREEQPVVAPSPPQDPNASNASGVIGTEPKKVRTIVIHPDGSPVVDAAPAPAPAPPPTQPPARVTNITPAKPAAPPVRVVNNAAPAAAESEPAPRPAVARPAPAVRQGAEPASNNAPLSLSPDAPAQARAAPARAAAPPTRTAAVESAETAPAQAPPSGSYAVQVSSQRSEAEAQAAFRSLQGKYPGQLGGKQVIIHRADLGDKGIYFRALVPAGSSSEAAELCSSLKSAGGSCLIQRN